MIAFLRSSNAVCCSFVHLNFVLFLVSRHRGSQWLEKLLIYWDRYASICKNDTSSSCVFGGVHSCTARILSGLGFNPSAVNICP